MFFLGKSREKVKSDSKFFTYSYRFGFNGQEKDNDVKGEGNSLDFGARIYDSRLGRFLSIDPLAKRFASESNYIFAGNSPTLMVDKEGKHKIVYNIVMQQQKDGTLVVTKSTSETVYDDVPKGLDNFQPPVHWNTETNVLILNQNGKTEMSYTIITPMTTPKKENADENSSSKQNFGFVIYNGGKNGWTDYDLKEKATFTQALDWGSFSIFNNIGKTLGKGMLVPSSILSQIKKFNNYRQNISNKPSNAKDLLDIAIKSTETVEKGLGLTDRIKKITEHIKEGIKCASCNDADHGLGAYKKNNLGGLDSLTPIKNGKRDTVTNLKK